MGTSTNKPPKALIQSTINLSVIMTEQYPKKFAILHMLGWVVNSKKHLSLQECDRKHELSNEHIKHEAV